MHMRTQPHARLCIYAHSVTYLCTHINAVTSMHAHSCTNTCYAHSCTHSRPLIRVQAHSCMYARARTLVYTLPCTHTRACAPVHTLLRVQHEDSRMRTHARAVNYYCEHIYLRTPTYTHTLACTHIRVYANVNTHTRICVQSHTNVRTHDMYIHIDTFVHA